MAIQKRNCNSDLNQCKNVFYTCIYPSICAYHICKEMWIKVSAKLIYDVNKKCETVGAISKPQKTAVNLS